MPRRPQSQIDLHKEADRFEPRFRRAFIKSMDKVKSQIPLVRLSDLLAKKDVHHASEIADDLVEAALEPLTGIVRDAFMKGGKLTGRRIG